MNTSSSWKKWLLVSVALLVLGGSIARAIIARKAQQTELAQSTESAQAQSIYLAPHDVHTVQVLTLNGSIPISGSLIAQRSAVVKAKVSAELQALHVREGDTVRQGQSLGQLDTQEVGLRRQQAQQQAETCDDAQGLPRILLNIGFAGLAHGITALAHRLAALGEGAARALQVELNLLAQLVCLLAGQAGGVLQELFSVLDQCLEFGLQRVLLGFVGGWRHGRSPYQ